MDVQLPDGTVIQGVPDGTSKAELVAKLQRNGYDTSWYKSEKGYARRVLEELPGTLEGSARMLAGAPGYIAGGVAGAAIAPFAGIEAARAVQEGVTERLSPDTYIPTGGRTDAFNELMGAMNESVGELGQAGGEAIGGDVGGLIGQIGAQTALQLVPIPGMRSINRALEAPKLRRAEGEARLAQERVKAADIAKQKAFTESAVQRDWITEQAGVDMGPPREPSPVPRGPQRDFWEAEAPLDRGLEEPARREGGPIEYTKESPLDLEARGKETPPIFREDGISYEPVTDGVSKILEQSRQADIERAFEKQQSETRSGLPKQAEIDLAYEAVRPEQPGPTFLERLEQDLIRQDQPRRVGPTQPLGGPGKPEGGAIGFTERRTIARQLEDLRTQIEAAKKPGPDGLVDYKRWQELGEQYSTLLKKVNAIPEKLPISKGLRKKQGGAIDPSLIEGLANGTKKLAQGARILFSRGGQLYRGVVETNKWVPDKRGGGFFAPRVRIQEYVKENPDPTTDLTRSVYGTQEQINRLLKRGRVNLIPSDVIEVYGGPHPLGGPGKKQGGAFTPFSKREPKYDDFLKELKYAKLDHLPDAVKTEMWKGRTGKPTPTKLPEPMPGREVVEGIRGLDKETQELYYDQRSAIELGTDLKALYEAGGGDIGLDVSLSPNSYRAANHTARRWANSKINSAYDTAAKEIEGLSIGTVYKGTRRIVDPDSPRGRWQSLPKGSRGDINKLGNYLTDRDLPLTEGVAREVLGRDLLPSEVRAMEGIQKVWKYILDEVINKDRVARGLEPIRPRNFYWSPATWAGDYIYFLRNKEGELVHVFGTRFRPDSWLGKTFNRELNRKLKEMGVKLDPQRIRRKTTPEEFSIAGLEVLLENMGPSKDPAVKAVRDLASEVIAEFNEKRARGMERQGRPGYEGSQTGRTITGYDRGAKAFESVLDRSLQAAVNIKASQAVMKAYKEFLDEPSTSLFPKAREAASRHFERSLGHQSRVMQGLDKLAADILDKAGLPPSYWDKGVNFINGVAIRLLMGFWLPIQIGIQVLQPGFALAKMVDLFGKNIKGMDPKLGQFVAPFLVMRAVSRAVKDIITRDNSYMKALAEEGALSPSMKHEYTGFGETAFGENLASKSRKFIIGDVIQQFAERNVVRAPAARLFYHTLKDIGVSGDALIRITKGLTEDYMVSWDRHKKSGWIANAGAPGRIFGALQSFSTTQLAQFLEYGTKALTKGEIMPLVTFLSTIYVLGGMVGMIGVKEADAAINLINRMFGLSVPTATEYILTSNQSDMARYGAISAATGTNVSASLGGASVTYVGAPGPSLALNALKGVWTLLKYAFKDPSGKPLEEEKREAYKGLAPRALHGAIENEFAYTPNSTDARGAGIIRRDEFDRGVRHLGTFSLKEAEAKRRAFINKKEEALLVPKRTHFIERSVQDLIKTGKPPSDFASRARELKYRNSSEIRQAMLDHLRKKLQTADQRAMGRGTSGRDQRAYQLYQRLMSEEERARANQSR